VNDNEPMNFSALNPERDPARWAGVVTGARLRVEAALAGRRAPGGVLDMVHAWSRLLLPAAAVLAVVLGAAGAVVGGRSHPLDRAPEARRLAVLTGHSISRGERPTGLQLSFAVRSRRTP
jgi:hypothetical protein